MQNIQKITSVIKDKNSTILGAAGIVGLGFLGSRILGLLRSIILAEAFGTDPELAAYWVAFRIPDLIFQLIAGATLSAAFIPIFSRVYFESGPIDAWRLASRILNLIALLSFVFATIAFVFAPSLIPLIAPGLGESTGNTDLIQQKAIHLTRLMMISPIFFGISGMFSGILQAREKFLATAIAPMIYNLSIILGILFLSEPYGLYGPAWGVAVGSLAHAFIQIPAIYKSGMQWNASISIRSKNVLEVLKLMGPRIIGLSASQINLIALLFFASLVSDTAISVITYAYLMMMLPIGLTGMSISTAVFPTLAKQAAAKQFIQLQETIWGSLRAILFIALPTSIALAILAEPLIRLLFEHGAFNTQSTDFVVRPLIFLCIGIFAHAGIEVLSRGFYALENTKTPVAIAITAMLLNIILCYILINPLELIGVASAMTISAIFEFIILLWLLNKNIGGLFKKNFLKFIVKLMTSTFFATLAMITVQYYFSHFEINIDSNIGSILLVLLTGSTGALVFLIITFQWFQTKKLISTKFKNMD
ncbi:MAG: murein biosynthesis integral membrane protein MurJ [Chloroflexi bacterium]|nr:murein biosynthesis integral membrane protein MurJ [Chloroflexota bacterium]|tara:strand:+ start:5503 stop:7104 length:1602 start_codon:yes stop_codon:yes gene_type:complete